MREIKFRAWDGKKMQYDVFPTSSNTVGRWVETGGGIELRFCDGGGTKVDIMQFTGLKDKNGKEDYDGNIWEVEYQGKKHRFSHKSELSWEGYIFSFKCLTGEISSVHANVEEEGIIIGNVHQPDLMEKE